MWYVCLKMHYCGLLEHDLQTR